MKSECVTQKDLGNRKKKKALRDLTKEEELE